MRYMQEPALPLNESERLELLHQLHILDTESEEIYDGIAYIASKICEVPISTISLIDHDRQWFKSIIGGDLTETPRIYSFCAHTILGNEILEVTDSHNDERFKENPYVLGEPYVRFYAGIPLELKNGLNVGTLCVVDNKPRKLTEDQLKILHYLSLQVTKLLESRLKNIELLQKQKALDADLNAASQIQKSFLPLSPLDCKGLKIASIWKPANNLGGDIYNIIKSKEKIIFYIVDVCGHDVPSALVTVSISQFFHQHIQSSKGLSPKDIMLALNDEFPLERFDRFFTICYLIVDPTSGHLKYSCAAHPPAIILKKRGGIKILDKQGPLIGFNKTLQFEEGEEILESGDKVFLYTDGIIELKNSAGEQFGIEKFNSLLEKLRSEPIDTIIDEVSKTLKEYNSNFQDDVSLLAFEKE